MSDYINDSAQDLLFRDARTYNGWQDKPVEDALLHEIYDLMKWAPTSANSSPLRIKFVKGEAAKARLKPHLMEGNVDKTMTAPVTALFAHDMKFYDHFGKLFPHADAKSWFTGNDQLIADTAFRNGSLQAAYFMLAARGLGLDCGPMSGFDADGVEAEFFAGDDVHVNFICNLGYGDADSLYPRSPRFDFDDICEILSE